MKKETIEKIKPETQICEINCPVSKAMNVIGGTWKPVLLFLINQKINRFGEMQRNVSGISKQMLTKQLRELERDGIIDRKVFPVVPPHVEYSLTEKGKLALPSIRELAKLGRVL